MFRMINLPEFVDYMHSLQKIHNKTLKEEFQVKNHPFTFYHPIINTIVLIWQELSSVGRDYETNVASDPKNRAKNRYKNIYPCKNFA